MPRESATKLKNNLSERTRRYFQTLLGLFAHYLPFTRHTRRYIFLSDWLFSSFYFSSCFLCGRAGGGSTPNETYFLPTKFVFPFDFFSSSLFLWLIGARRVEEFPEGWNTEKGAFRSESRPNMVFLKLLKTRVSPNNAVSIWTAHTEPAPGATNTKIISLSHHASWVLIFQAQKTI